MQHGKPTPSRKPERFSTSQERSAARFLDRDLITPGALKIDDSHGKPRLVPDREVSSGITFVQAQIDGIDRIEVCRTWIEVEKELDRGPRKQVIARLNERIKQLREIGERPERLEHGPWPDCDCCDSESMTAEAVRQERARQREAISAGYSTGSSGSDQSASTTSRKSTLDAFATDGGEDQ